jgi:hypothetical protein
MPAAEGYRCHALCLLSWRAYDSSRLWLVATKPKGALLT